MQDAADSASQGAQIVQELSDTKIENPRHGHHGQIRRHLTGRVPARLMPEEERDVQAVFAAAATAKDTTADGANGVPAA